ncbi:MAG TPA: hypothetical protein VHJ20_07170 [Polyangia bacterium]|nr:hypothetical protein [Polyangia bacterium]
MFRLSLLAALAVGAGACKVDQNAFEDRIFHCDTTSPDPLCGTDATGHDLTCFAARQIGGVDFCAPACSDTPMSLPEGECVQGGALLSRCAPNADTAAAPACGRADLGCLRTDVLTPDEGVCLTMNPCTTNTDCRDPVRSTCGATFLKELYTQAPDLNYDHLYCLQEGCDKNQSSCSPGETCLKKVIPAAAHPIDICVPNCDSQGRCPPNHFCLSTVSGPANPPVCIPGLLGFVCQNDIDCLVGKCKSDGDPSPLTLCTASCQRDQDCSKFDSVQGHFVCSTDGRCITPDAYTGTLCNKDSDCGVRDKGTACRLSPVDPTAPTTCLRPCDPTKLAEACPARGGIGHTCLPFLDAADHTKVAYSCFPGDFGLPCFDHSNCAVPELQCVGVNLTAADGPQPGFCTVVCSKDSDCTGNRWTGGDGYCGGGDFPFCIPLGADGTECTDAKQCQSKTCGLPPQSMADAKKVCGGTGT